MKKTFYTLSLASMLMACGQTLPLAEDTNEETQSNDDERKAPEDQVHIGADGEHHFYPSDNGIDVTFREFSLIDSDESDDEEDLSEEGEDADEAEENNKAAKKCGDWIGADAKITKVTGNQNNIKFEPNSVIALFVAGNKNKVSIDLGLSEPVITDVPQAATVVDGDSESSAGDEPKGEPALDSDVESETAGDTEVASAEASDENAEEVSEGKYIYEAVEAPVFDGICLILAGNQAQVDINVNGFAIGNFAMVARGNEPAVKVTMDKYAEIKNSTVDIRGNGGSLTLVKEGEYECPEADIKSKSGSINCE